MKTTLLLFLQLLIFNVANAQQNLVPNPSFEDTLNCNGFQLLNSSFPWFNPTLSTPDYYYGINPTCGHSAINNASGFQIPRTGNAYIGLYLWTSNARDYIEVQLLDSLKTGHHYQLDFYVSRANLFSLATYNIGAFISNSSVTSTGFYTLPFTPQIINPINNYLVDSSNWISVSGFYKAIGGEKYMTIGNFNDNANTNLIDVDSSIGTYNTSMYYLDDVSLIDLDSSVSINEFFSNESSISIYPNPLLNGQNLTLINQSNLIISEIDLYNKLGEFVSLVKNNKNPFEYKLPICNQDIYILRIITSKGETITKKIFIY